MSDTKPISEELLRIIDEVDGALSLPRVKRVWLPQVKDVPSRAAEFGAVVLQDDSVGLTFVLLGETLPALVDRSAGNPWEGMDAAEVARGFRSADPAERVLGLGAISAIGQHVLRRSGFAVDTKTNSIASFNPGPGDRMGMVGFFPPLVKRLVGQGVDLTVVELKAELVRESERFRVTLDPEALRGCNQILCTSTMLLNDSVDRMLTYCEQAEQVAVIGPSAGFLPDPLFARGVDTVGGQRILDVDDFFVRVQTEQKWGPSARKYCIHRDSYPGYRALLESAR